MTTRVVYALLGFLAASVLYLDGCKSSSFTLRNETPATVDAVVEAEARRLARVLPPRYPVTVVATPSLLGEAGALGRTRLVRGRLLVEIQADLSSFTREELEREVILDTLIHEWGHALEFTGGPVWRGHHGPEWGIGYARAYGALYGGWR